MANDLEDRDIERQLEEELQQELQKLDNIFHPTSASPSLETNMSSPTLSTQVDINRTPNQKSRVLSPQMNTPNSFNIYDLAAVEGEKEQLQDRLHLLLGNFSLISIFSN